MDQLTKDLLKGKMGERTLGMWYNVRYESYKFYNDTSMLHLCSQPPSPLCLIMGIQSQILPGLEKSHLMEYYTTNFIIEENFLVILKHCIFKNKFIV